MTYSEIEKTLREFYNRFTKENATPESVKGTPYKGFEILDYLDSSYPARKSDDGYQLKALQYKAISEGFEPVIFTEIPFYFEMATKQSFSDGTAYARGRHPGGWTCEKNMDILTDGNSDDYKKYELRKRSALYCICGPRIELMHYGFPYENIFAKGLSGIYEEAKAAAAQALTDTEKSFTESALAGLEALKLIAGKFSEKAENMLASAQNEDEAKALEMIADTAKRVPWEKPTTFYEGLGTIAFLRETAASLEGVGISSLGRPDKYLSKLYQNDIASGTLTRDEAYDLICKFLLIWDCRHDRNKEFHGGSEHELECTLELGGCGDDGKPLANEVTALFLEAYKNLNCIYPKFQCRYSSASPRWYLEKISEDICGGRSNYLLANDDAIIKSLVKSGKTLSDARKYIVSGCWDVFVDGAEHRPGGEYLNLIRPMEWAFRGDCKDLTGHSFSDYGISAAVLRGDEDFESVYRTILSNIDKLVKIKTEDNNKGLRLFSKADPLPMYSACMEEPLRRLRDIHNGGAKYAPGSIYYVGFANLADSLMAIKHTVFDRKRLTLPEMINALRNNWRGFENIRSECLHSPYFCDGSKASEDFCRKLNNDLCDIAVRYKTVTGDNFDAAYLVYVEFLKWGEVSAATPDGRHDGDMFSHGIGPARNRTVSSVTEAVNGAAAIGLDRVVNSIDNLVLSSAEMTPELMCSLIYAIGKSGLQCVHLNRVTRKELIEAQLNPEGKENLIVRVCGFSAKFTSMNKKWQDEFINRNQLK